MADTWGQNPYQPYTQNAADWERQRQQQQKADDDRLFRDRMAELDRNHARQMESLREISRREVAPSRPAQPAPVAMPQRERATVGATDGSASGGGGLALLGAVVGLVLAAGAGASVLGGLFIGGVIGALLVPVLKLVGWLTVTLLKIAFWVFVVFFVLAVLGSLGG